MLLDGKDLIKIKLKIMDEKEVHSLIK